MFLSNKSIRFKQLLITISLSFLFLYALNPEFFATIYENWKFNDEIGIDIKNLKISKISEKIHIDNNWTDAKNAGICTGSGTYSDPYVIKDLVIDGEGSGSSILIENSNEYFKIKNCTVYNCEGYSYPDNYNAGIKLKKVNNGTLINNNCSFNKLYGIYLWECYNNTLSENTANVNNIGIYINRSNYIFISDNNVSHNTYTGISLISCNNNNVSINTIKNDIYYGIWIAGGNDNIISDNIIINNDYGIYLQHLSRNIISENKINNSYFFGIYFNYNNFNNNVSGNLMNECGIGINGRFMHIPSNNIDNLNLVNGKPLYFYTDEICLNSDNFTNAGQVILFNCNDSLISNLNVSHGSNGISLFYCENNTIAENNASFNCQHGIYLEYCENNIISNNIANDNVGPYRGGVSYGKGIFLQDSNNNALFNNCADDNSNSGIGLENSDNNNITGNIVNFNDFGGLIIKDCNNNTISENIANNNYYYGIFLSSVHNNTISNNTAKDNEFGIFLIGCNNNTISRNTFNNNKGYGIYISSNSNKSLVSGNYINYNNNDGIYLRGNHNSISNNTMVLCGLQVSGSFEEISSHNIDTKNKVNGKLLYYYANEIGLKPDNFSKAGQVILINCNNSLISNLNISHISYGISLYYCTNNTISNNNVSYNSHSGIIFQYSDNNTVSNNIAINNGKNGIYLFYSNNNNLSRNLATKNSYGITLGGEWEGSCNYNILLKNTVNNNIENGIHLISSSYNILTGNNATNNNKNGIYFKLFSNNNKLLENNAINNYYGLYLEVSNNNTLNGNKATNNFIGIYLHNCDNNLLRNNINDNNGQGIYLYNCENNNISGNCINNNSLFGIYLYKSHNNTILGNEINNNKNIGIMLYGSHHSSSDNNCIYYNYLSGNELHAEDNGINNKWDSGSLGNYWDNYIGADTNDDGIGDDPYLIIGTANSYDYFPIWDDGDDLPPIIKINSPAENTKIGRDAPDFNIEIIEPNLDTLWYTLDGGLTNLIFTTNGTIDQTLWENLWDPLSDGDSIAILFYANDTFGKLASKDVKVIKDDYPKITIISPLNNDEFDRNAPSFIIEINETDLDTLWYIIDGGITIKTFTTNGTIDQTLWENLWDTLSDGDSITIRFYANDTLGQIGNSEVIVLKNVPEDSEEPEKPGEGRIIQGYNMWIFISCIFAISIILIKKRVKI